MLRQTALILTAALAAGATQAPPDGPCDGRRPGPPPMAGPGMGEPMRRPDGPPMLGFLGLTEPQKQAVKAIMDKRRPARSALHRDLEAKAMALMDAREDPALAEARLRALQAAESEARLRLLLDERAEFMEVRAVLTADQQAKAERLRLARRQEREARASIQAEAGPE